MLSLIILTWNKIHFRINVQLVTANFFQVYHKLDFNETTLEQKLFMSLSLEIHYLFYQKCTAVNPIIIACDHHHYVLNSTQVKIRLAHEKKTSEILEPDEVYIANRAYRSLAQVLRTESKRFSCRRWIHQYPNQFLLFNEIRLHVVYLFAGNAFYFDRLRSKAKKEMLNLSEKKNKKKRVSELSMVAHKFEFQRKVLISPPPRRCRKLISSYMLS